ncbi:MAG: hypothetical protein JO127_06135 [Caulobacteraceae bacterium]|nr:hypothetical protein [Caulobacteraceae bacterium]
MKRLRLIITGLSGAILMILAPAAAQAHLVATGLGPVYDGIAHFGLSPEDFLPVIALGFYAGLTGAGQGRAALAGVTLGWLIGGAAVAGLPPLVLSVATAALYLVIGGLLAAKRALQAAPVAALGFALGVARGAADFAGALLGADPALTLAGMAIAVFAVLPLAASVTLPMRRTWIIVAARVSGSWLAALGILFAGWLLRFGKAVQ